MKLKKKLQIINLLLLQDFVNTFYILSQNFTTKIPTHVMKFTLYKCTNEMLCTVHTFSN